MTSLAILGVGKVGGETAFLSAALGLADEIILYDAYEPILRAQVLDLQHTGIDVTVSTDTAAMRDADIFIFAAGTRERRMSRPGPTSSRPNIGGETLRQTPAGFPGSSSPSPTPWTQTTTASGR